MAKMTKAQKKRMVRDIESKAKKLFMDASPPYTSAILTVADVQAIEKLCSKWLKRIG